MVKYLTKIKDVDIRDFKIINRLTFSIYNKMSELSFNNGGGKTSIVNAFQLLKLVSFGGSIPCKYLDWIFKESDHSFFKFGFELFDENDKIAHTDVYEFCIRERELDSETCSLEIFNERFIVDSVCALSTKGEKLKVSIFDGANDLNLEEVEKIRKRTALSSKSFIFNKELSSLIGKYAVEQDMKDVYYSVVDFLKNNLIIIDESGISEILKFSHVNVSKQTFMETKNAFKYMNKMLRDLGVNKILTIEKDYDDSKNDCCSIVSLTPLADDDSKNISTDITEESRSFLRLISLLPSIYSLCSNKSTFVVIDDLEDSFDFAFLGVVFTYIYIKIKGTLVYTTKIFKLPEFIVAINS